MNTSPSMMAPVLADYHQKSAKLRSNILRNEEERIILEQKLRSLSTVDSRLKQQDQTERLQSYFTKLDQESQQARQRNSQLINDLTQAEHHLNQLRIDAEHVIRLKQDYLQYLESNYPDWQKHVSSTNVLPSVADDHSTSESTSNTFSRSKRAGSLRMELSRTGLYFLLDYIESELIDTIEKKKFYHYDPPTITQKRTILDIANDQRHSAIKDLEPTSTSMVILDQLPSTIRRTTVHQCLLTDEILSLNVIDLQKDSIVKMLPEQDRMLWIRLIDHFTRLVKHHIMNSEVLANKFAPTLLPSNALYLHDKAKSVLKHLLDKLVGTQQINSDDDASTTEKQHVVQEIVKTNPMLSSSWMNKLTSGRGIDDDDDDDENSSPSSSVIATSKKNLKSGSSTTNINPDDSDLEFFS